MFKAPESKLGVEIINNKFNLIIQEAISLAYCIL